MEYYDLLRVWESSDCATTLLRLGRPTSEPIPSVVGLNRLRHSACLYLVLF